MVRSIWKGSLSFGLVNVPVKVVSAVRSQGVRFHQLHDADGARIQQKRVCSADGEEVDYDHIVKGYEVGPDEYVIVTPEELDAVAPDTTDAIEIQDFVDISQIDPLYYEKPYYLVPDKGAAKPYALLLEAMRRSGRVAIARVVMRTKEHLVAVRPVGDLLAMTTLLYHDELVAAEDLAEETPAAADASAREVEMAERLIDALTTEFDPSRYTDEYRERVLGLIETKRQGETVVAPAKTRPSRTTDLASALEESLKAIKDRGRKEAEA